jgi:hypothetical protein
MYDIFITILLYKLISRREKGYEKNFIKAVAATLLSVAMLVGIAPTDNVSTVYASTGSISNWMGI